MEATDEGQLFHESSSSVELAKLATIVPDITFMSAVESETLSQVLYHLLLRFKLDLSFLSLFVVVSLAVLFIVWVLNDGLVSLGATKERYWRLRVTYSILYRCRPSIQWIVDCDVIGPRRVLVPLPEHEGLHMRKVPLLRMVLNTPLRALSTLYRLIEDKLLPRQLVRPRHTHAVLAIHNL